MLPTVAVPIPSARVTMIVAVKKKGGLVTGLHKVVRLESGDAVIVVGNPQQLTAFAREHSVS